MLGRVPCDSTRENRVLDLQVPDFFGSGHGPLLQIPANVIEKSGTRL